MKDFALLTTVDQTLRVVEADNWGAALAQFLEEQQLEPDSMLTCYDPKPVETWTSDIYTGGDEETVIVLPLEDLEAEDPQYLPHPHS